MATIPNALPVRVWQFVPWHAYTAIGVSLTSYRRFPQEQPPVRIDQC
jgi:hypothetical protein